MSVSELGFLCGLIKRFRPKKLVEVGVAAGGTSAVILNCIQSLDLKTEMYSVNLSEKCYKAQEKASGYLLQDAEKCGVSLSHHTLLLGTVVAARLDEIGNDIDLLVLDTTHSMPGENLDFLACLPYLKNDAIVVLHDTAYQFSKRGQRNLGFATSILFQTVAAKKFLNNASEHPNIAAFQITDDTRKYVMDVFAALMIPWQYMPEKEQLGEYEKVFANYYPEACIKIYEQAQKEMAVLVDRKIPYIELANHIDLNKFKNILLYGTKKTESSYFKYLKEADIEVKGFIVSDGRKHVGSLEGIPVYEFSKIPYQKEDTLIVQASAAPEVEIALQRSGWCWCKVDKNL